MAGGGTRRPSRGSNVSRQGKESVSGHEAALGGEYARDDALILGRIEAGGTCTLGLGERDQLSVERGLDAGVEHVNRETEASDRVPVGVTADGPEDEARIAVGT